MNFHDTGYIINVNDIASYAKYLLNSDCQVFDGLSVVINFGNLT